MIIKKKGEIHNSFQDININLITKYENKYKKEMLNYTTSEKLIHKLIEDMIPITSINSGSEHRIPHEYRKKYNLGKSKRKNPSNRQKKIFKQ